jgi:hypothetical protein
MSRVKIVGQMWVTAGVGDGRGGHFTRPHTKRRTKSCTWRDCGSKTALSAAFDPQSPMDTSQGYNSSGHRVTGYAKMRKVVAGKAGAWT